eukprot:2974326-Rhodomonas_salina.1
MCGAGRPAEHQLHVGNTACVSFGAPPLWRAAAEMSAQNPVTAVPPPVEASSSVPVLAAVAEKTAPSTDAAAPAAPTPSTIPYTVASVLDTVAASLKRTRKTWTDAEKKAVLDLMHHAGSKQKTINELRRRYGAAFQTISRKTLKQWQKRAEEAANNTQGD